jgi:uncharacterized membrane protein
MARSGTPELSSAVRRKKPATGQSAIKKAARATPPRAAKKVAKAAKSSSGTSIDIPKPNKLVRFVAKKTAKKLARKSAEMSASALRRAADRAAEVSRNAYESGTSRLVPIQLSIDVAVPIHVAWEEWRTYGSLPEGVHRIVDVERDGDVLIGRTAGPRELEWEAEIKDEREDESFAWRSVEGTDVAGLATFHKLSDRLTRIELDLDVVPTNPSEAMTLALHFAHRRAEADLRRFKAHVEFISPDAYPEDSNENGSGRANGSGRREKRPARKE